MIRCGLGRSLSMFCPMPLSLRLTTVPLFLRLKNFHLANLDTHCFSSLVQTPVSGSNRSFCPIFLMHLQERDSRMDKAEGSGLGMAITKKLTELFGGSITVDSQLDHGTTFHIELPMKVPHPN